VLSLPVVHLPVALAVPVIEISVAVACKPMWQNMRAYQSAIVPVHMLMLNCCWYLYSILSAVTNKLNVSERMLIRYMELVPKV
jgi:hypothetical protein